MLHFSNPFQLALVAKQGEAEYLAAYDESDEIILIRCHQNEAAKLDDTHPVRVSDGEPETVFVME